MITDEKFEQYRKHLYLEECYPLLHETTPEKIPSILSNGLHLDKGYHGEITRVVSIPKTEKEYKEYRYYSSINPSAILVLGVPKDILNNISIHSSYANLLLNGIPEKDPESDSLPNSDFHFYPVHSNRIFTTIPPFWINGFFDNNNDFFINPTFILRQENSLELVSSMKQKLWTIFQEKYPDYHYSVTHNFFSQPNDKNNTFEEER